MATIKKSEYDALPYNFNEEVGKYAQEVRNWKEQERNVELTKSHPDPMARYAMYPFPQANELIMSSVSADGDIIPLNIVDDTQEVQEASFDAKQFNLFNALSLMERDEKAKIVPTGKVRLFDLHFNRIKDADEEVRNSNRVEVLKETARQAPDPLNYVEIGKAGEKALEEFVKKNRDPKDQSFLDEVDRRNKLLKQIDWWAAEQSAMIADLTPETIDGWKITPFEGT